MYFGNYTYQIETEYDIFFNACYPLRLASDCTSILTPNLRSPNPIWTTQTCAICDYSNTISFVQYLIILHYCLFQFVFPFQYTFKCIIFYFLIILIVLSKGKRSDADKALIKFYLNESTYLKMRDICHGVLIILCFMEITDKKKFCEKNKYVS